MLEIIHSDIENLSAKLSPILGRYKSQIKAKTIFIKPNLGGRFPLIKGENNDIEFLSVLCNILCNLGSKEISIGHSSLLGFGYSKNCKFEELISMNRYESLLGNKKVKFINLDSVARNTIVVGDIAFRIPELLDDERTFYINLCKMKTHMETMVSLSLKNQMGLLDMENRKEMHRTNLHLQIARLGAAAKPDLNIIDGIVGMEGNGPHHGNSKKANVVLVGDDSFEADCLACEVMGFDIKSVDHLMESERIGLGKCESRESTETKRFRKPKRVFKKGSSLFVWPSTSCSACIFSLSRAVEKLMFKHPIKTIRKVYFKETHIIMGQCKGINAKEIKNVYAVGNCSREYATLNGISRHIKGCPPSVDEIVEGLND